MRVRRLFLTILSASAAAFATASSPSSAPGTLEPGQPPTPIRAVVELFTSQGCSSCPPADALLKTLSDDPSIMALTLPVDYWNYLGWKDTFASSRNSDRQRNYAKVRGDGAIYTPQAIVNGILHVNGASKTEIESAIETTSKKLGPDRIPVRFWQENNTLNIATGGAPPGNTVHEATIWFGVVQISGTVDVKQGENQGKSLTYTNIVRELTPIGLWKGQPMQIQIPRGAVMLAETQKSVVLIQEGRAGPIIGAAWAGLW
jgi:hypothetical protein